MPASLPERPDLAQLRRQAKELLVAARRGDAGALHRIARVHPAESGSAQPTLAVAQLVIAREVGFPSWPKLKAAVETEGTRRITEQEFVAASVDGRMARARQLLRAEPDLGSRGLRAAAVLGEAGTARRILASDPAAAAAVDEERGWPPLLYACYSRWHETDPRRAEGIAEVVRLLLAAGAGPNTNDGGFAAYRSALKGSVEVNNPEVTEVLLGAGAQPDPGGAVVEAVVHPDHRCLELLIAHGARVAGTWALGAAVHHDDARAVSLLLEALAAGGEEVVAHATGELADAAAHASLPVVAALLAAGADVNATDGEGVSALRLAVRAGRQETAERLRAAGATNESIEVDRLLGACLDADRREAERLVAGNGGLGDRLSDEDLAVIVDAASSGRTEAVALMLDLGWPPSARRSGEEALHAAAYGGHADVVRVLLGRGADVDARDDRFDATPLAFAAVGSGEQAGGAGDWAATVTLLIEAGASREGVWVPEKPPSEEVGGLLRSYGVHPREGAGDDGDTAAAGSDAPDPSDAAEAPGVLADVARHLQAAYRDRDLDLFASLLHPDVRWTPVCRDRTQVLEWYRRGLREGSFAEVQSVEVDRDAVILGLAVARRAEGARPAAAHQRYQVFTVEGAQIVEIRGYPDRASAYARS